MTTTKSISIFYMSQQYLLSSITFCLNARRMGTILAAVFASFFLLKSSFALSPVFTGSVYAVTDVSLSDAKVTITLDLTQYRQDPNGDAFKLETRSKKLGLTEQVSNPRCGTMPLQQNEQGQWLAPASCALMSWVVPLKRVQQGQVDAARQESLILHGAKWLLLSEATSILHVIDAEVAYDKLVLSMHPVLGDMPLIGAISHSSPLDRDAYVPLLRRDAPEFYILGDVASTQKQIGVFRVRYIADDEKKVDSLLLNEQHEKSLLYLSDVLGVSNKQLVLDSSLLVIRFGAENKLGYTNGAAGRRSMVVNYALGSAKEGQQKNLRSLLVTAHEQFHQLASTVRWHTPKQPAWVEESLAQYYALQSLKNIYPKNLEAMAIRNQFINEANPIHEGLMSLQQKLDAGDRSVSPLFYTQGATFWARLDQTLLRASNNETGLNDVVRELILSYPNDKQKGALPQAFTEKIIKIGGAPVEALLAQYVDGR